MLVVHPEVQVVELLVLFYVISPLLQQHARCRTEKKCGLQPHARGVARLKGNSAASSL